MHVSVCITEWTAEGKIGSRSRGYTAHSMKLLYINWRRRCLLF